MSIRSIYFVNKRVKLNVKNIGTDETARSCVDPESLSVVSNCDGFFVVDEGREDPNTKYFYIVYAIVNVLFF